MAKITLNIEAGSPEEIRALIRQIADKEMVIEGVNSPVSLSLVQSAQAANPGPIPNAFQPSVVAPVAQPAPTALPTVSAPMAAGAAVAGNMATATAVPIATPQAYTQEQLAVAAMQLMDAGRRQDLVNLLAQFGAPALTALPKEQYGNFATQLRALGAKL